MGKFKGFLVGGILSAAVLFAMSENASAQDQIFDDLYATCMNNVAKDCQSWAIAGGGGSGSPRGLTNDSRAELAIGEKYILTGTIEIAQNQPYLRISFSKHPWLASSVRVKNPYYRISDEVFRWKKYRGKEVAVVATAKYSAWAEDDGRTLLEIFLQPSAEPIIDAIQPLADEPIRRTKADY